MFYFFDRAEALRLTVPFSEVQEAHFEEALNTPTRLTLMLPKVIDLEGLIYVGHHDPVNTSTFTFYRIMTSTLTLDAQTITAVETAYDELIADGYVEDLRPTKKSAYEAMSQVLAGSRWQVGRMDTGKLVSTSFYFVSRLEAIQKIAELAEVEIRPRIVFDGHRITSRLIDIYTRLGSDKGERFVHGSNLLDVIQESAYDGIYTALVGRGKGEETGDGFGRRLTFGGVEWKISEGDPVDKPAGANFVEIPSYTAAFGLSDGRPRIGIVEFPEVTDPAELLQLTFRQLEQIGRPQVLYKTRVLDVGRTALGDTVTIIREDYNIRYKVRIVKRTVNLLMPSDVEVELGDKIESFTAKKLSALDDKVESVRVDQLSGLEQVRELISQISTTFWGEDGYNYDLAIGNEYGLPAGMYSFDKPIDQNPTKLIYFGAGKLVVSNSKNPDGTWNFTTLMDGGGLATGVVGAEQIKAGAITADHIAAGAITANLISLDNGRTLEQVIQTLEDGKIWTDYPVSGNYKLDEVLHLKPQTWGDLQARGWTWGQITSWGLTVADLEGGGTYVCIADGNSAFDMRDWVLVARNADQSITAAMRRLVAAETQITDAQIKQTATEKLVDQQGATVRVLSDRTTQIEAGRIQLGAQTPSIEGAWTINRSIVADAVDGIRVSHSDGSYTLMAAEGIKRYSAGTGKTYIYQMVNVSFRGAGQTPVRVEVPPEFRGKVFGRDFYATVSISEIGQAPSTNQNRFYVNRFYCGLCPPARIPDGGPEVNDTRAYVLAYALWINPTDNISTYDGLSPATGTITFYG